MRCAAIATLLVPLVMASTARADIGPPAGYDPPPRVVVEAFAALAFRGRLRGALTDREHQRLPVVEGCPAARAPRRRGRRGSGFGGRPCRPDRRAIYVAVADRAVRWLAPRALAASGDLERARALEALEPITTRAAARAARAHLRADAPALAAARAVLEVGAGSTEELAARLADLVRLALDAGADRPAILEALPGLLNLLTEPARERPRLLLEVAEPRQGRAWRDAYGRLRQSERCLDEEFARTGFAVHVEVRLLAFDARVDVVTDAEPALDACLDRALGSSPYAAPPSGQVVRARLTYAPRHEGLFTRVGDDGSTPRPSRRSPSLRGPD